MKASDRFDERARFRLHHPAGHVTALHEAEPGSAMLPLAQRAIAAFQAGPGQVAAGPLWDALLTEKQDDLSAWLAQGNTDALAHDLAALGRSRAAQGFFGGAGQHRKCAADPAFAQLLAAWTHDKLVSLAESVGAIRLELPENGAWGRNVARPAAELFALVERKLGVGLAPPAHVGGYLGIAAGNLTLQMRVIEAIYAAWRLKQIADARGMSRVCEIGAGAGLTAYYANLLGIADYVIIDLPTMNAVQAYMLGGSRIGATVALHGEDPAGAAIRILPHTAFATLPAGAIDILYNQDSMPEIDPGAARAYLRDAHRLEIPLLLSINQEAHLPVGDRHQESVSELIMETGGFALASRHRHWLRQGYAEESYERR